MSEPVFPDVLGAITAFRSWHVNMQSGNPHLGCVHSLYKAYYWTEGENVAHCRAGFALPMYYPVVPSACPGVCKDNHGCGFYAYHNRSFAECAPVGAAWGVVSMYGTVEIAGNGLRASKARILAFHPRAESVTSALEVRYPSIPVFGNLTQLLDEFPLTDVSALL